MLERRGSWYGGISGGSDLILGPHQQLGILGGRRMPGHCTVRCSSRSFWSRKGRALVLPDLCPRLGADAITPLGLYSHEPAINRILGMAGTGILPANRKCSPAFPSPHAIRWDSVTSYGQWAMTSNYVYHF